MIVYRYDAKTPIPQEPPILNDVPSDFVREAKRDGLPGLLKPTEKERKTIQEQINRVWALLGDTVQEFPYPICGVYLYDDYKGTKDFLGADGMCNNQEKGTERRAIIGIGRSAADRGRNYLTFLLLHEAAHAAVGTPKHNDRFHQYLDYLLLCFNRKYDTALENDYVRDEN